MLLEMYEFMVNIRYPFKILNALYLVIKLMNIVEFMDHIMYNRPNIQKHAIHEDKFTNDKLSSEMVGY